MHNYSIVGVPYKERTIRISELSIFQLCTGIDEKSMGSCFQLVFAPINELFPDDAPLISSGFRVIPLDIKTVECFLLVYLFEIKFVLIYLHRYCSHALSFLATTVIYFYMSVICI
jgi:type IV secretory pathway TrbL component